MKSVQQEIRCYYFSSELKFLLFPLWDPDIVEDWEKQKRGTGPLNNTMKQKKSARREEVVQAATDNRELVFFFCFSLHFCCFKRTWREAWGREDGIKSLEKEARWTMKKTWDWVRGSKGSYLWGDTNFALIVIALRIKWSVVVLTWIVS